MKKIKNKKSAKKASSTSVHNKSISKNSTSKPLLNREDILKIPNFITALRIILAPVFLYLLFNEFYVQAFVVAVIAALSDLFDGLTARKLNMVSKFGAILDPIADVTFTTTVLIGLLIKIKFPLWLGVIILSREIVIIFGGLFAIKKGKIDMAKADLVGKLSRFSQVVTLILFLLVYITPVNMTLLNLITTFIIYSCGLLTLISLVNYINRVRILL